MQQIRIYLIFISFSIKKNTDLKENRSVTCQICYLPLLFYCFRRKHRYQSRSHYRVIEPNCDRNSCIWQTGIDQMVVTTIKTYLWFILFCSLLCDFAFNRFVVQGEGIWLLFCLYMSVIPIKHVYTKVYGVYLLHISCVSKCYPLNVFHFDQNIATLLLVIL